MVLGSGDVNFSFDILDFVNLVGNLKCIEKCNIIRCRDFFVFFIMY